MVSRALKLIEGGALDENDVDDLADRLEIGQRHLRRLFRQHIGAAPVTVAQTRRVLLAKQLIHQTDLPMIDIAIASGFGSVRRFNETFDQLYGRPPSELRRRAAINGSSAPQVELLLPYRPPYDWEAMIRFLQVRAIAGVELVTSNGYSRVIELGDAVGTIHVTHAPEQSALRVVVRFPQLSALSTIITRIRRMFDLSADPGAIAQVLSADPILAPLMKARPGLRVPGGWDGFEIAVRAVLGQQITVKGATKLAGRIVAAIGAPIGDGADESELTHAFPRPQRFKRSVLSGLGIVQTRAAAIVEIAGAADRDPHLFDPRKDLEDAIAHLRKLPGVGEWTAHYIAMRAMGESDAFLARDVAVQRAMEVRKRLTPAKLLARSRRWSPWRAYAVLHLWMANNRPTKALSRKSNSMETCHALTA